MIGGKDWMEIGSMAHISGWISAHAIFIVPITVGIIIQLIKFVGYSVKNGWDIKYAMMHGHMPSTHTAFMTSLVTAVALFDPNHLRSGAFAISLILAIIVIDDAARLRIYMGDYGRRINAFARKLNMFARKLDMKEEQFPDLKEILGHQRGEVIIGGILGVVLTLGLAWILG